MTAAEDPRATVRPAPLRTPMPEQVEPVDVEQVHQVPSGTAAPAVAAPRSAAEAGDLQASLWTELQARFVDDPEGVVHEAAELVSDAIARLLRSLDDLAAGDSTEDLRRAFQRYREMHVALIEV